MADAPPIGFMQGKQDVSHKAALEFQGLSFSYASERSASGSDAQERALIDVTGHVHAGEVVAIIGPNGAGKSTLLRLLAGLEKLPTGRITLQGAALADFDHKARARAISLVPQALVSLPEVRVYDFVLSGRYAHQRSLSHASKTDQAVVEQALRDCDVLRFADRLLSQLSSGQRQRVLIARALAQAAPVMIVDEPTSNLDPAHKLAVFDLLANPASHDRAILVVTHDLNLASQFATRILVMHEGRIVAQGTPNQVLCPAVLTPVYGKDLVFGERETPNGPRPFVMAWR